MILEHAILNVITGREAQFEMDFRRAEAIISAASGYLGHKLIRSIEHPAQYLLLVKWRSLEDHTQGFRKSNEYEQWKSLLHHYYEPFPSVEHYELNNSASADREALSI